MGVNPAQNRAYVRKMKQEQEAGINRPLTDLELAEQMKEMIKSLPEFKTLIGCFNPFIDGVGYNPINFGSEHIIRPKEDLERVIFSLTYEMLKSEADPNKIEAEISRVKGARELLYERYDNFKGYFKKIITPSVIGGFGLGIYNIVERNDYGGYFVLFSTIIGFGSAFIYEISNPNLHMKELRYHLQGDYLENLLKKVKAVISAKKVIDHLHNKSLEKLFLEKIKGDNL